MERPWAELAADYRNRAESLPQLATVLRVANSVIENRMQDKLTACSSMYDLIVTTNPPKEPPIDVIIVRSPVSMWPPPPGKVVIDHLATNGLVEHIVRPEAEAEALFWRFVAEKFGIHPERPQAAPVDLHRTTQDRRSQ
jgi:hypothetical protein